MARRVVEKDKGRGGDWGFWSPPNSLAVDFRSHVAEPEKQRERARGAMEGGDG